MSQSRVPTWFSALVCAALLVGSCAAFIDAVSEPFSIVLVYLVVVLAHLLIVVFIMPAHDGRKRNSAFHLENSFHTWFELYYNATSRLRLFRFRVGSLLAPILPGTLIFLIGWIVTLTYGFSGTYLDSVPIYLGWFGICWVTTFLFWSKRSLTRRIIEIGPCFAIDPDNYYSVMDKWFSRFTSYRWLYTSISTLATVASFLAYVSIYLGPIEGRISINSIRPTLFPSPWYQSNKLSNLLVIDLFAIACSVPLGTGIWLLVTNSGFLTDLRKMEPVPIPQLLVTRFRGITTTYLAITFTWFVGVSLFAILLFRQVDPFSVTVVLGLGALGLSVFLYPQYVFHCHVARAYSDLSEGIATVYRLAFGNQTFQAVAKRIADPDDCTQESELGRLTGMVQLLTPGPLWVFDLRDVGVLLLGQAIALAALLARTVLRS